jgi:[lysine-biosynthesis-protein LysW]--L-2-aminoadipate ligase
MARVALLGGGANGTTVRLAESWRRLGLDARRVSGWELAALTCRDLVIGRLDVLPSLDGVEPGLFDLLLAERRGVEVRNHAAALLAAHDKLRTVGLLRKAGIPQPRSAWVRTPSDRIELTPPLVVKPRFGSWGDDVHRCETEQDARVLLTRLTGRPWFHRHGALVQELVPPREHDLRVLVAGGRVIGAAARTAVAGDWRTNVSLGGRKEHAEAPPAAAMLALAATRALGCDLVAVDLLPVDGGFVVLELNAAADFDDTYVDCGKDVDAEVAVALGLPVPQLLAAG